MSDQLVKGPSVNLTPTPRGSTGYLDVDLDCSPGNAASIKVTPLNGASVSFVVEGADAIGGLGAALDDTRSTQTSITTTTLILLPVPTQVARIRITSISGGTVIFSGNWVISPGLARVTVASTADLNVAQWNGTAPTTAAVLADAAASNPTSPRVGAVLEAVQTADGTKTDRLIQDSKRLAVSLYAKATAAADTVLRAASAAVLAGTTQADALLVNKPGDWPVKHVPAENTQATASKAAGAAGVRHVCTSISAALASNASLAALAQVSVRLRDGLTGAGTILWEQQLSIPNVPGSMASINLSDLHIVGSAATAMTLEFSGAGGAGTLESVSLTGHSVV